MPRWTLFGALTVVAALAVVMSPAPAAAADGVSTVCRFSDSRFTEISGMTYSQLHPGVLYLHNDSSGGPRIYAVDSRTCETLATITIDGIDARDIEAIGSGRDRKGCPILWVADIGDNVDSWSEVRLHRVREPKVLQDRTLASRTYRFTYSDRPHNAEAILSDPNSLRVWVVTKQSARGRLYALPDRLLPDQVNIAKPVRREGAFVTDGSVRPDGSGYALRDYVDAVTFVGLPPGSDPQTVYLPLQLQGEAMTWTPDGTALLVAGERDDRLLRVELPVTAANAPTPVASPSAAASAAPSPGPSADAAPVSTDDASMPVAVLAVGLVGFAGLVIAIAEVRRRRAPAAPRG